MKNKLNNFWKVVGICLCLLIGIGTVQAQTLTNQEMKNLVLVAGYTGVGAFPAVVVARPKDATDEAGEAAQKVYLLTAKADGSWTKKELACARGVAMSTDGKRIWIITNPPVETGCFDAYELSMSVDAGKTWKSSREGFRSSGATRFERIEVNAGGNGRLIMFSHIDDQGLNHYYLPTISSFVSLSPRLGNGDSASELPPPSRGNIAQITLNNFESDNANTLESKKTWMAKLAKTKEAKRREMPQ